MAAIKTITLAIPNWVSRAYVLLSAALVPWTVHLGATLPPRHVSVHWDASWAGLDVALCLTLLLTGVLAYVKSRWLVIAATTAGSFLLADAWFDIMSERGGAAFREALLMAVLIELPLAIISYGVAVHALHKNVSHR